MASCTIDIDTYSAETSDLEVIEKYEKLMQSTLGDDSLYTRSKETLFHHFEDLQLTEKEKAGYVLEFIGAFSTELSKSSMTTALHWAKEERDGIYQLAQTKAETVNLLATREKIKEEICVLQKEDELKCVTIEATMAASIRDNGTVSLYDSVNPCKPIALNDEGLKYEQIKQVQADSYRLFADSYRKSGVVELGTDPTDSVYKGLNGTTHDAVGEISGYTAQQTANAERQRIAYEDSKVNHAANSSASMIGQMLSAEVAPSCDDVNRWRNAVDRLLSKHETTNDGYGPEYVYTPCPDPDESE